MPKGRRGAGETPAAEPMSPRPVCALVRMPAELVRFQYRQYSLDKEDRAYLTTLDQITLTLFSLENRVFSFGEKRQKVR